MKSETAIQNDARGWVSGLLPLVALGGLFGYLLAGDVFTVPLRQLASSFSLGLVWSYLFLQWVDLAAEYLALKGDPAPAALDVADRAAVKDQIEKLCGGSAVRSRIRHLFRSWSLGWHPRQVMGLAGFQSTQAKTQLNAGVMFALILLLAAARLQGNFRLTWGGLLAVGLTVLARQTLLLRVDRYIECRILARLPSNIPQTAMTAADLAGALGASIQSAFKSYVPQPDQMAAALRTAVEGGMQNVVGAVEKFQKSLGEGQGALAEKWAQTLSGATKDLKSLKEAMASASADFKGGLTTGVEQWKAALQDHTEKLQKSFGEGQGALTKKWAQALTGATADLKGLKEALASAAGDLKGGLAAGAEQWKSVLQTHTQSLDKSLAAVPGQLAQTYGAGVGQIVSAFKDHAEKIAAASQGLQTQLDRIAQLGKEIEKVLRVQETVDGTLKAVAATAEFRKTLETLSKHVESSDALLREAAKPRIIRLVESDGDVAEG